MELVLHLVWQFLYFIVIFRVLMFNVAHIVRLIAIISITVFLSAAFDLCSIFLFYPFHHLWF